MKTHKLQLYILGAGLTGLAGKAAFGETPETEISQEYLDAHKKLVTTIRAYETGEPTKVIEQGESGLDGLMPGQREWTKRVWEGPLGSIERLEVYIGSVALQESWNIRGADGELLETCVRRRSGYPRQDPNSWACDPMSGTRSFIYDESGKLLGTQ